MTPQFYTSCGLAAVALICSLWAVSADLTVSASGFALAAGIQIGSALHELERGK